MKVSNMTSKTKEKKNIEKARIVLAVFTLFLLGIKKIIKFLPTISKSSRKMIRRKMNIAKGILFDYTRIS